MINTVQDLEALYYGSNSEFIAKADAPVLSTTTGVYNAIFGKFVWAQLNQEANTFGLLPKNVWDKSGWRLQTTRAGTTADGGVAEAGTLPETIKPDFIEVTNKLKTVAHNFEVSERQEYLNGVDDATSDLEHMRMIMGVKHKEAMNQQLLVDASAEAAAASADYAGKDGFETIDRVISSDSEEDAFGGTFNGYFDIFGLDRDTATTYDSYVDHNSGTDRTLTDTILRDAIYNLKEAGAQTTVINTGYDTLRAIIALYTDQVRYSVVNEATVKVGVNGIESDQGIDVGIRVATVYQLPLISGKDTPKDTISRIYLLDTSDAEGAGKPRIGLSIAKPTQYFQAGIDDGTPFSVNKFTTKGMFRTMGEIMSPRLDCQGKIRDLA